MSDRWNRARSGSLGFTLLELLVAVAIIAVLAGLLLAGIQSARERGSAMKCVAHLQQLAQANLSYVADNDGSFVPAQERTNRVRWHGVRGHPKQPFDPREGPLAPYLGKEGRVKLCPTFQNALKERESFENGTGGYGYNAAYIGGTPAHPFVPAKMSNVERASRTVMFADTAFARAGGLQEYAYAEPFFAVSATGRMAGALSASVHFRHGGRANVAWCDGHVTAEEPSKLDGKNSYGGDAGKWKIGWFGPEENNGYWRPW